MKRFIQILAILLIIQLAVTVVVFWPRNTARAISGPLLSDFSAADVVALTIQDNDANRLVLARRGDEWVLPEADDFPVDGERVTALLDTLEGVEASRLVTQTEASHKRLKVAPDDFDRMVEITSENGLEYKLYLGSSAGAGATHVRLVDQPEVYLGQINAFDTNPQATSWIDTLYYSVSADDVTALTVENENGTFEFEKDGDAWKMLGLEADARFDESAFNSLLSQVTSVRMTAPLGKEEKASYQLTEPLAAVSLKAAEGDEESSHTIRVGAKIDDDSYVVKSSQSSFYVTVNEFVAGNFIEKTRDDFLLEPPAVDNAETTEDDG